MNVRRSIRIATLVLVENGDDLGPVSGAIYIEAPGWRNELCGRLSLTLALHRPGLKADRLPCSILIAICDQDSLVVPAAAEAAARRAGTRATVKHYPIGHFDISGRVV